MTVLRMSGLTCVSAAALLAVSACEPSPTPPEGPATVDAPEAPADASPPAVPETPASETSVTDPSVTEAAAVEEETRSAGVHIHGLAQLTVAQDGETLQIEFETPGYNLIGFERPPANEAEQAAIDAMNTALNGPLVTPNEEAGCSNTLFSTEAPFLEMSDGHDHSHDHDHDHSHDHDHDHSHDHGDHSHDHSHDHDHAHGHALNAVVTWTYTCAEPANLTAIDISIFSAFERMETLEVVALTDGGTVSADLTADASFALRS